MAHGLSLRQLEFELKAVVLSKFALQFSLDMGTWVRKRKRAVIWSCVGLALAGLIGTGWTIDRYWPSPDGSMTVWTSEPFLALFLPGRNNARTRVTLTSNTQRAEPTVLFDAPASFIGDDPWLHGILWKADSRGVAIAYKVETMTAVSAYMIDGQRLTAKANHNEIWINSIINENLSSLDSGKKETASKFMRGYDINGWYNPEPYRDDK